MKTLFAWLAVMLSLALCGCAPRITFPRIDSRPAPADFKRYFGTIQKIPHFDPASTEGWQVDLRSTNLSGVDARSSLADLLFADFDDDTSWPPQDRMPAGFDAKRIMDLGKDPGLGVRTLHARGVTGKGVGIAIIDQALLVDHVEYVSQLRLYEEVGGTQAEAAMHAPAVASIAVGKSVGVAPGADLYFLTCPLGTPGGGNSFTYDFTMLARAVRRVLEINRALPRDRKIHVISISVGWSPGQAGYKDIMAAVDEARKAGMLVVSSSLEETYGFKFHALGRAPLADPNRFESYEPGLWLARQFYSDDPKVRAYYEGRLMIPMDSRTTASPTGTTKYVFYREGGWSWSIPYIAGVYALACQVSSKVTPQVFWETATRTGKITTIQHDGKPWSLGPIIDPVAIVGALGG